jgi:hypothetical protein
MKIEQLLAPFLIQNKEFSLQDIGTFYLVAEPIISKDEVQNFIFPEDSIQFTSDKNANKDDLLIQYITENTKKIKPLATSDLESFTMLSKQFLNLGKPLILEGIGSLTKNRDGILEFTQANKIVAHKETASEYDTKEAGDRSFKKSNKEYNSNQPKKSNLLVLIIIILSAIIISFVVYYLFQKDKKDKQQNNVEVELIEPQKDTSQIKKDSTTVIDSTLNLSKADSNTNNRNFKIIVRNYNNLIQAQKGLYSLSKFPFGKNLIMYTKDSVQFYLAVPMRANLNDSLKIKDSLKVLFGKIAVLDLE